VKTNNTMTTRRESLNCGLRLAALMASAGLLSAPAHAAWSKEAFDTKSLADTVKALGGGAPVQSADITLTGPDIAENGAVVPVGASTSLPGVRRLALLVEKNPNALAAAFDVSEAVEANVAVRVKMGQSSNVIAVAMMADGRVLYAQKEIKVTLGGCGG
jgi:sulfur-oxidizing protein SoxY